MKAQTAPLFTGSMVSDQKRLARGEHLLLARTQLRIRDEAHQKNWRAMILAGGSPAGEIHAIRELMPRTHVVAVDRDPVCLEAAIDAGADEVVHCDLTDWGYIQNNYGRLIGPNVNIASLPKFDLVHLDLCSGVNDDTKKIISRYQRHLTNKGVLIVAFSYGRDVAELFGEEIKWLARIERDLKALPTPDGYRYSSDHARNERDYGTIRKIRAAGIPDSILGRILYLFPSIARLADLVSVISYKGNEMPMCSLLMTSRGSADISFVRLGPADFELAVVYPDSMNLYDCPRERIDGLRRKFAAIKASLTRQLLQESDE